MIAWLQNVYDAANNAAAAMPAETDPDSSDATSTSRAHAIAASIADARLSARAGSAAVR